jgi:hypothetical protein
MRRRTIALRVTSAQSATVGGGGGGVGRQSGRIHDCNVRGGREQCYSRLILDFHVCNVHVWCSTARAGKVGRQAEWKRQASGDGSTKKPLLC